MVLEVLRPKQGAGLVLLYEHGLGDCDIQILTETMSILILLKL
jgi:hypothetical protein